MSPPGQPAYLAVVVLVRLVDHQSDGSIRNLLNDQDGLL